jgi:ketosteroid isomerase-like protein
MEKGDSLMRNRSLALCVVLAALATGWAAADTPIEAGTPVAETPGAAALLATVARLADQVRSAEIAFAKAMAARDHDAFASHVADEALFFGRKGVLRGKVAVAAGWKPFFEGEKAPFSWEPETVEVLDSGALAFSSGPVRDPEGRRIGTFNSIWRREADGRWKVVFDKGCPPCESPPQP